LSIRTLVLLALIVLAVVGLGRFHLDVEVLNLLPTNNSISRGLLIYQQRFLNAGELVVTLQAESSDQATAAVKALVATMQPRSNLVERLFWQPPRNDSIRGGAQFLAYLWLNAPPDKVRAMAETLRLGNLEGTLAATREKMTTSLDPRDFMLLPRDPYNLASISAERSDTFQTPERFFSSEDGKFRIIYMYAAVPVQNYDQCHEWVQEVRTAMNGALAQAGLEKTVKLQLTGRPVFVDEIASGMKNDMRTNAPGTLFMIGLLFFLVHRELRSLILLLFTLLIVMVWTALVGAAFIGQVNVISIGFASILLGLAEDFGIVLHQEAKSHPHASAAELRSIAGEGIFWSAVTTAAAFALLNFSSLPGLRQLGTLVGLGILLGAWVMTYMFLPLVLRFAKRKKGVANPYAHAVKADRPAFVPRMATLVIVLLSLVALLLNRPRLNPSPDVLRPRQSEASRALTAVQENLGVAVEPYWVLASGQTVRQVRDELEKLEAPLAENVSAARISSFNLPTEIWPKEQWQEANAPVLREIAGRRAELLRAALSHGFTTNALDLTSVVLDEWRNYTGAKAEWPRGRIAEWLLPKFVSITPTNYIALGLLYPTASFDATKIVPPDMAENAIVSGWRLLGKEVLKHVEREVPLISVAVLLIVLAALYLTFRHWTDVALSFAVLALSGLILLGTMGLLNWDWNLINLTSLPLLLGMGIDYSIHIQLTLRRLKGNRRATFQSVGRALLLAGSTSIIGFALLGNSSNLGMSSLGKVCAMGLTILLLVSVFLLPGWSPKLKSSGSS
jgi:predicted RND superfamily exporter protein